MNDLHMHISFSLVRKQAESEKDTENIDKKNHGSFLYRITKL